jgi:hypothetical protein
MIGSSQDGIRMRLNQCKHQPNIFSASLLSAVLCLIHHAFYKENWRVAAQANLFLEEDK